MLRPLLERDLIKETFIPNFSKMIQLFGDELDRCKHMFDSHLEQVVVFQQIFGLVQKGHCVIHHLIPEKKEQAAFEQEHACYDRVSKVGKNA